MNRYGKRTKKVKSILKESYNDVDYREKYFESLKEVESLKRDINYCTFKMYWNGLKNRINRKDLALVHKGGRCWYKSFNLFGSHYMFIKNFDKERTYFYKEFSNDLGEDYIKFYYLRKDGKLHFGTEVARDYGDRTSC